MKIRNQFLLVFLFCAIFYILDAQGRVSLVPAIGNSLMEGNGDIVIFLPLVRNGEPEMVLFTAGPIQSFDSDDIYVYNFFEDEVINLTNFQADYFHPNWSPDGSRISYCRQTFVQELFIMNADGSDKIFLENGCDNSWSPDGLKIVFKHSFSGDLLIINVDGSGLTQLVDGGSTPLSDPNWSPNGGKIAYIQQDDIWVINSNGTGNTNLTSGFGGSSPKWSPDGSQILFGNNGDLFVMNANGSDRTNITNSQENEGPYGWSPDGSMISFKCGAHVCVSNSDGSGRVNVSGTGGSHAWGAWSPDGSWIAYVTFSFALNDEIYMVKPDGSDTTLITQNPLNSDKSNISWRP